MRRIQTLLLADRELCNTKRFQYDKYCGCPINTVRTFSDLNFDEIALLRVSRFCSNEHDYDFYSRIVRASTIPIAFGGGVCNIGVARELLSIGFDKLVINSFEIFPDDLFSGLASLGGAQSISLCINYERESKRLYRFVGEQLSLSHDTIDDVLPNLVHLPIGEIFFQDVSADGEKCGYDRELYRMLKDMKLPFQCVLAGGVVEDDFANLESSFISFATGTNGIYFGNLDSVLVHR